MKDLFLNLFLRTHFLKFSTPFALATTQSAALAHHGLFRLLAACCIFLALVGKVAAQNTQVTYQGRLLNDGTPYNGLGQFQFALVTSTNANHTATATANAPSGGYITGYVVTLGGNGYVTPPIVTVFGGGGSNAAAHANLTGGTVSSVSVDNPGNGGYASAPTVLIAPPPASISYTTYWSNDGTSINGSQPSAPVYVAVSNGLFTVVLGDTTQPNMAAIPASLFNRPDLQLRIWFNDGVHGALALDPVQSLTPTPYAAYANIASNLVNGLTVQQNTNGAPNIIGGASINYVSNGVVGATIAGGGAVNYNNGHSYTNRIIGDFGTISGGFGNVAAVGGSIGGGSLNTAGIYATMGGGFENSGGFYATVGGGNENNALDYGFIGGGFENSAGFQAAVGGGNSNKANGSDSVIGGGFYNVANGFSAFVGGGDQNTANGDYSTVVGGAGNAAKTDYAMVGGGQQNIASGWESTVGGGFSNFATNTDATIGGGHANSAGGTNSTVGGGIFNLARGSGATVGGGSINIAGDNNATIGGGTNNSASLEATVSGGSGNTASGYRAAVGGGYKNTASADYTTVIGGNANTANALYATVGGGFGNTASGIASFAGGYSAQALHSGSFVWADYTAGTFSSTASGQFSVRASGGVRFFTSASGGVQLGAGGTSWGSISDRNAKKNFAPTNQKLILEKLAQMPIQQWNYKWESDSDVPNIGPMAQDFKAAFYPGRDDKSITTLEFDGVELAAIQGLNEKVDARSQKAEDRLQQLEAENANLKQRLEAIEKILGQ